MALAGIYPSRNAPEIQSRSATDPFLGEIMTVGFTFCPRGWAELDGQLLDISTHTALFSLLGTTYGGDGRTTFALPDLRGRTAVHEGQGPGLSNWPLGLRRGVEEVTLTEAQMPSHSHTLPDLLLGDMNGDGEVNGLDVDPFVALLLGGGDAVAGAVGGTDAIDGLDVVPFVNAVLGAGARSVPEPTTLFLALVAVIGTAIVRARR
jgi:hypothetical protein